VQRLLRRGVVAVSRVYAVKLYDRRRRQELEERAWANTRRVARIRAVSQYVRRRRNAVDTELRAIDVDVLGVRYLAEGER
jgi:hypothetical protein